VGSLNLFGRTLEGDGFKVSYRFIDHHGMAHEITCRISRADHAREVAGYGYREPEVSRRVDDGLRTFLASELRSRGLTDYVSLRVENGRVGAESQVPPSLDPATHNRWVAEIEDFYKLWEEAIPQKSVELRREILAERGVSLFRNVIRVDHRGLAIRASKPLADCFRALERAGRGYNDRQYLGLFVAFFQEIRYEVPPSVADGKQTLGLWVPTEVLVNNHGDCDSKAVAFGALWRNFDTPTLVIDLPDHVLVGVPVRPGPGEHHVLIKNRYYLLAEVAGPAKSRPGSATDKSLAHLSGNFLYRLVPPVAGDSATRSSSSP
jgi:hypothetical protein